RHALSLAGARRGVARRPPRARGRGSASRHLPEGRPDRDRARRRRGGAGPRRGSARALPPRRSIPLKKETPMRPLRIAFALCFVALPLAAQTVDDPALHVNLVTSGLSTPTSMAFVAPGDILVLQKNDGQVRRVKNGVLQAAPVLDFPVSFDSERGLLGIAVSRDVPPPRS